MKKIHLTGAKRYNHNSELFLSGEVYVLDDKRADYLLEQFDRQTGYSFFEVYTGKDEGKKPGVAEADEILQAKKTERPQRRVNAPMVDRPGRAPKTNPIEDADAITV